LLSACTHIYIHICIYIYSYIHIYVYPYAQHAESMRVFWARGVYRLPSTR